MNPCAQHINQRQETKRAQHVVKITLAEIANAILRMRLKHTAIQQIGAKRQNEAKDIALLVFDIFSEPHTISAHHRKQAITTNAATATTAMMIFPIFLSIVFPPFTALPVHRTIGQNKSAPVRCQY